MGSIRDYSLDALKMMLITLVIYAHIPLLDGFMPGSNVEMDALTWRSVKGIYAFHMPLFVLLSGYFTRRKEAGMQWKGSLKLLRLFVLFHVIDLALQSGTSGQIPTWQDIIYPSFALWYLLCLFYWRMLISILPARIDHLMLVAISVVASLLVGFVPIRGEMGFHRFFSLMPYFFVGHYYGKWLVQIAENMAVKLTPPYLYYAY